MSAAIRAIMVRERARAERARAKTREFLKGLDDEQFGAIRSQILGMVPFPSLTQAKNIIAMSKDTKPHLVDPMKIEYAFEQLQCTRHGLTSKEANRRLKIFGPNRLDSKKKENKCLKLLLGFIKGKSTNVGPKCRLLRDNKWKESKAGVLVPGDIIRIKYGDIVPADARLLQGNSILVNQYVLTRQSIPVVRGPGEDVFSGSTCTRGHIKAVVIATGVHASGKPAAHIVHTTNNVGHFKRKK